MTRKSLTRFTKPDSPAKLRSKRFSTQLPLRCSDGETNSAPREKSPGPKRENSNVSKPTLLRIVSHRDRKSPTKRSASRKCKLVCPARWPKRDKWGNCLSVMVRIEIHPALVQRILPIRRVRLSTIFQSAVPPSKWSRRRDSHSRGAMPGNLQNCCCRCRATSAKN